MSTLYDDEDAAVRARTEKILDEQADAIRERLVALRCAQIEHVDAAEAEAAYTEQLGRYELDMALGMLGYVLWYGTASVDLIARERLMRFNNATNTGGDPVAAVLEEINRA